MLLRGPSGAHRRCGKNLADHSRNGSIEALQCVAIETMDPSFLCVYCWVLRQIDVYSFIVHQANFEHVLQEQQAFLSFYLLL